MILFSSKSASSKVASLEWEPVTNDVDAENIKFTELGIDDYLVSELGLYDRSLEILVQLIGG